MNAVSLNPQSPKQVFIFVPENKDRIQKKTMLFGNIYVFLSRLKLQLFLGSLVLTVNRELVLRFVGS